MILSRRAALGLIGGTLLCPAARSAIAAPDLTLVTADGRRSVVTVWRARHRRGTILFSHGALSAPGKYTALLERWVTAGFDVLAPLHVDSTDHPDTGRFPGQASWPARIEDLRALARHVGTTNYVAAGHSYGALVALTLGGASPQRPAGVAGPLADPRVSAVVAFSPPGPGMGLVDAAGYATLARPALIQTGTKDVPPGVLDPEAWRSHLVAYEAPSAGGHRYGLVLPGADHYFGGLICRPELPGPPQVEQFAHATAVSIAFLRAYGMHESSSLATLRRMIDDPADLGLTMR